MCDSYTEAIMEWRNDEGDGGDGGDGCDGWATTTFASLCQTTILFRMWFVEFYPFSDKLNANLVDLTSLHGWHDDSSKCDPFSKNFIEIVIRFVCI